MVLWQSCHAEDYSGFMHTEAIEQGWLLTEGLLRTSPPSIRQRAALCLLQSRFLDRASLGMRLHILLGSTLVVKVDEWQADPIGSETERACGVWCRASCPEPSI